MEEKRISVVSVLVENVVNSLTGKIGQLDGVSAKTLFSKI